MCIFFIIVAVLQGVNAANRETLFVLRSMGILLGVFISVIVLFAPKIHYILSGINAETARKGLFFPSLARFTKLQKRVEELEKLLKV